LFEDGLASRGQLAVGYAMREAFVEFQRLCEDRVRQDNFNFGINSIYVPNPVLTETPEWCLIAMEPSLSGMLPEFFQRRIDNGFLNFLWSEGDFILHYCAYTFLCKGRFKYHFTDISKGAMNTGIANSKRRERYANWIAIIKDELRLFEAPCLIGVGGQASDFLRKYDFPILGSIMHYSQNNNARFRDYYLRYPNASMANGIHKGIKTFTEGLLDRLNYEAGLKRSILDRVFNEELPAWKKGMFISYADSFSDILSHNSRFKT
jgi:hypothetical protein